MNQYSEVDAKDYDQEKIKAEGIRSDTGPMGGEDHSKHMYYPQIQYKDMSVMICIYRPVHPFSYLTIKVIIHDPVAM